MNTIDTLKTSVNKLLNSNISSYRINKDFPEISENLITRLRTGYHQLDNTRLYNVERVYLAYLYYAQNGKI